MITACFQRLFRRRTQNNNDISMTRNEYCLHEPSAPPPLPPLLLPPSLPLPLPSPSLSSVFPSPLSSASPSSVSSAKTKIHPDTSYLSSSIQIKDTIPFIPPITIGVVVKVYDGDTITIASKLPYPESPLYRFSVRLNGIDCPEIKGAKESEKQCAQIAKQEMMTLVMNQVVTLRNVGTEKYGRILADVYVGEIHTNQHMIEKRLAVAYDGGTKMGPTDWMDYYTKGEA